VPLDIDPNNFENEMNDTGETLGNLLEAYGLEEHTKVQTQ
jgi:hypothetical protein